jgi:hypothetical protein
MKEKTLKTIGNTVSLHHVYCQYYIQNGWLWQRMDTLSCAVYGTANPLVSSYMPLGLGLRLENGNLTKNVLREIDSKCNADSKHIFVLKIV